MTSNNEDSKKDAFSLGELSAALSGTGSNDAKPGIAGLVDVIKSKIEGMSGSPSEVLDALPIKIRKRVEALREMQKEHDELEAKFYEERLALETKYQKMYQPLYTKRYEIVNGVVEAEGVTDDQTPDGEESKDAEVKGVPDFWITALKANEHISSEISERDEGALKYLKDIKWCRIDNPKGFKLDFFFDTNPYFKNSILTKTYHMIEDIEPILERAIGTEIQWYPGKCLTHKILKKKSRKGVMSSKPMTKTQECESFFNFFNPPEVPEDEDTISDEQAEELQGVMEQDYDIGSTIRDKIIPHAVSWFTGEATDFDVESDDDDDSDYARVDDDDDYEEDDEEYDDEEDESDEDEEESKSKKTASAQFKKNAKQVDSQSERPPECKQQ